MMGKHVFSHCEGATWLRNGDSLQHGVAPEDPQLDVGAESHCSVGSLGSRRWEWAEGG